MTATDELRRLLDERGVKWWEEDGHTLWYGESTHHAASAFSSFLFGENERVHLNAMVTPEQAIAATLGAGTCRNISNPPSGFLCSECGWGDFAEPSHLLTTAKYANNDGGPNFCPNCGRKVVDE